MPTVVAAPLPLSDEERSALERMARSSSLPHRQVTQAQALLWAGEGVANEEIARRSGVDPDAVRRWRRRFAEDGVAGVGMIATEAVLAVAPWVPRLRRPGTAVAVSVHGVALVLATTSPLVGLRLLVFGGTAVLLHAASAGLVGVGGSAGERAVLDAAG